VLFPEIARKENADAGQKRILFRQECITVVKERIKKRIDSGLMAHREILNVPLCCID
jgi:predicted component of viral defense system (DUF524 family)